MNQREPVQSKFTGRKGCRLPGYQSDKHRVICVVCAVGKAASSSRSRLRCGGQGHLSRADGKPVTWGGLSHRRIGSRAPRAESGQGRSWPSSCSPGQMAPGRVAPLAGRSSRTSQGCGCDSWSGHAPQLQFDPRSGRTREATDQSMFLSRIHAPFSVSLPLKTKSIETVLG